MVFKYYVFGKKINHVVGGPLKKQQQEQIVYTGRLLLITTRCAIFLFPSLLRNKEVLKARNGKRADKVALKRTVPGEPLVLNNN
jgi:hypothetical protein